MTSVYSQLSMSMAGGAGRPRAAALPAGESGSGVGSSVGVGSGVAVGSGVGVTSAAGAGRPPSGVGVGSGVARASSSAFLSESRVASERIRNNTPQPIRRAAISTMPMIREKLI